MIADVTGRLYEDEDGTVRMHKVFTPKKVQMCVYGTLKKGFSADISKRPGVEFVGTTYVPYFQMFDLGWFPGAIISHDEKNSIFVEVYSIPETELPSLDAYEGAPNFYSRVEIGTVYGDAFLYVLPPAEKYTTLPPVKGGRWEKK